MKITWDEWAVPTITGTSHDEVIYGMGFAQAQTNATEILKLYGIARGNSAEMWGEEFVAEDIFGAELGLDRLFDYWLSSQSAETLHRVDNFVDGFNAACKKDPQLGTNRRAALPVTTSDVLAHHMRVFVRFSTIDLHTLAWPPEAFQGGSNGWAVTGERSSTGGAMLMINPHLGWTGFQRWFEARTVSPGRDFHGASLLGIPWQSLGYSEHAGWGHTVNSMAALTVYEMTVRDEEYLYDGEWVPLQTRVHQLPVRGKEAVTVVERRSIHGPVITAPDGQAVSVRIAGITESPVTTAFETWWRMSLAESVEEIFAIQDELPLTIFNLLAADRHGSIGAIYCGTPAKTTVSHKVIRAQRLPGDDSAALWTKVRPASSMPRVINPPIGWVQNCNETPWFYTSPPLDPTDYPLDIAPALDGVDDFRSIASHHLLKSVMGDISPEILLEIKFHKKSILADIVMDELLAAADVHADLAEAVAILRSWDRTGNRDSAGYLLFAIWAMLSAPRFLAHTMLIPAEQSGNLPRGLADPAFGVETLRRAVDLIGSNNLPLDASIGETVTLGPDKIRADGGTGLIGILKSLEIKFTENGVGMRHSDTWMALVEFNQDGKTVGRQLLPYGNTTEPTAPSSRSQYELWRDDQLRPNAVTFNVNEGRSIT